MSPVSDKLYGEAVLQFDTQPCYSKKIPEVTFWNFALRQQEGHIPGFLPLFVMGPQDFPARSS